MPDDKFEANLLKVIAAELYFSLGLQAAREMYGKSYFSLGPGGEELCRSGGFGCCKWELQRDNSRFPEKPASPANRFPASG
jgi:hypothetical protein